MAMLWVLSSFILKISYNVLNKYELNISIEDWTTTSRSP